MKHSRLSKLTIYPLALLALVTWGPLARAQTVGRTPGTYKVSPTGAATYTIPIFAPKGPAGLQPGISLVYNSRSGNGYVGVGWAVAGLSAITRCNRTYAQDAAAAPISLSVNDGYCLDGNRLRLTSGTYGTAGSTYQTEIANFENVTAYGTAGNGPAYFVVQTHDGHTLQYGNGGNSQVLASGASTATSWLLSEVSDPPGNSMTIAYCPTGTTQGTNCPNAALEGTTVPSTISWTPTSHGASTYAYTMVFSYGTNVLPPTGYVAGTSVEDPDLLGSITINYNGSQVKEYVLTYTQSGTTARDLLTQIQECATSASDCLYPTTVTYQPGSAGVSTTATTGVASGFQSPWGQYAVHYDFNGDGLTDLVYQVGSTWYVAFATGTGYGSPVDTGLTGSVVFGDLLGTGTDGILAKNGSTWYYYTWNGSSFSGTPTGLAFDSTAAQFSLTDVNGDGLPDLVTLCGSGNTGITTRLNTSSGGTPSFSGTVVGSCTASTYISQTLITPDYQLGNLRSFDFNGDGRQDLAFHYYYCAYYYMGACEAYVGETEELISNGDGTFSSVLISATENQGDIINVTFANINNDACTDAVQGQTIYISACNGSNATTLTSTYPIVGVMDWNGDGLADLLENNGGTLYVQLSTATGFGVAGATSFNSLSCKYITFDANGDGLDDLGCANSQGAFNYYPHNGVGQPPDLMTKITDGYGNFVEPALVPMPNYVNWIYYATNDAQYPYNNYLSPLYIVANTTYSDPSNPGGTYLIWDYYSGASMNLQGRGFAGFESHQFWDTRNNVYKTFNYDRAYPYTGMLSAAYATVGNTWSQTIFLATDTTGLTTLDGTQFNERYFPYIANKSRNDYEVSGPEAWQLITTTAASYTYDNYGNPTSVSRTVTDEDSGSPYHTLSWTTTTTNTPDPNTNTWCLNLVTETQVAYSSTLSGSGAVTRTKTFTPDTTNCRYTQIVTEPSSSTYKVTEALGYDAFGNVNSDTVTGINMSARQTTLNWGTTGQTPVSVTDATNAATTVGYDWRFVLPSSSEDPNQLTTSWTYDEFGRKTEESRPDSTYTVWTYYTCTQVNQCWNGNLDKVVSEWVYNTQGSPQTGTGFYFDRIERPLFRTKLLLNGGFSIQETQYDSLGHVNRQSAPCTYGSCTDYWTTYSYDLLNRVTEIQRPISSTNGNSQTTNYTYEGRTGIITDPYNNTKTAVSDVNGWLRQTKDAYGYTVTLAYDSAGSRTSVTDSESNALWSGSYGYGLSAFLTSETDMDRGAWTYTVDALGELTAWTDAKRQSFGESYDALSRPLSRSEPDLFTQWTWGSTPSSHNVGKLASVCTGTGTNPTNCTSAPGYSETETYDSIGRPYQRVITLPSAGTFTYVSQYGSNGLLSSLQYPTSTGSCQVIVNYGYTNGVLSSLTDGSNQTNCGSTGTVFWEANAQNPDGQITEETLGNGIVTNRTYDAVTHWLGALQAGVGGGAGVKNLSFLYDEMGNAIQRQDNNLSLTESVHYDNDYRLSYTDLGSTQNLSISYDLNGNITSRSDVAGGAAWTYDPNRKHAVTQAGSSSYAYSYDANGNMITRQGQTIGWASYNYPTSASAGSGSTAESVSLYYGPNRQRWYQYYTGNGTTEGTYYVGRHLEVVKAGTATTYRHYIYAGNEPVAVYSRSTAGTNTVDYVLQDHQGSVAALTNSSGGTAVSESFTPYGNRRNPSTWSGAASNTDLTTAAGITRQAYTFQTQLGLWMGLNHMNGRVEDSVTGRFLSADPNIPDPTNAQDYNRYSYADNNPVTLTDPTGMDGCAQECAPERAGNGEGDQYAVPTGALSALYGAYLGGNSSAFYMPVDEDYNTPSNIWSQPTSEGSGIGTSTDLQEYSAGGGGGSGSLSPGLVASTNAALTGPGGPLSDAALGLTLDPINPNGCSSCDLSGQPEASAQSSADPVSLGALALAPELVALASAAGSGLLDLGPSLARSLPAGVAGSVLMGGTSLVGQSIETVAIDTATTTTQLAEASAEEELGEVAEGEAQAAEKLTQAAENAPTPPTPFPLAPSSAPTYARIIIWVFSHTPF